MKLFMAGLATETNTWAPIPTGREAFMGHRYFRHDASRQPPGWGNLAMRVWRGRAEADGIGIAESLAAAAQPAGTTVRAVYEELRDMILADLRAAMPVDIVLLSMHGAMVADGYDDCEGDTLARVRAIVGPDVVVGIELDLHCHLTETMRQAADLIVLFKEYPHTDIADRANDLYDLAVRTAKREIRPRIAYHDLRMISMWRTPVEPMKSFVADMTSAEGKDGILSVSFGHGFPWADVPDVGAKMVVIADGDEAKAARLAQDFGARLWAMRHETHPKLEDADAVISAALGANSGRPVVIADVTDNAGGGAPSDSTFLIHRLVAHQAKGAAVGPVWDPVAVSFCREAGPGARMRLRVGGKCGTMSGPPADLDVVVRAVADEHEQTGLSGSRASFGPSAWVEADGIHLLLITNRQQGFHPDAFEGLGLPLGGLKLVVVKSSQHFYAGFAPIASAVRYVGAPGAMDHDFAALPYTKLATPYWPRVEDPYRT
jgi:microcystin degradation protein MlrC